MRLSTLLWPVLTLAFVSGCAAAAGFSYRYNADDSITLEGWSQGTEGIPCPTDLVIPSTIEGKTVTAIAEGAFQDEAGVTSITIPKSVKVIGKEAFDGCDAIKTLTVSSSHLQAFDYSSLANVKDLYVRPPFRERYPGNAQVHACLPEGTTAIETRLFESCNWLKDYEIPEGVTKIDDFAFRECTGLTSITIPEGVTQIANSAFQGCTRLTSVTLPASVKTIGAGAFADCANLTSITIPEGVTEIADSAFQGCSSLAKIIIPNGVTSIGAGAFANCSGLTTITIPESVKTIGEGAFEGCPALATVHGNVNWQDFKGSQYYVDKNPVKKWKDPSTNIVWSYELLADNTAKVLGGENLSSRLEIPDELDGHPVTIIEKVRFELII